MTLRHLYERLTAAATTNSDGKTRLQPHDTPDGIDRRRHPRHPAAWPLRVWFGDLGFAAARAENVSISGIGLSLTSASAASLATPGREVEVELYDGARLMFRTSATVRHRRGQAVGLEWTRLMDDELISAATA